MEGGSIQTFRLEISFGAGHDIPFNPVSVAGLIKDNEDLPEEGDYAGEDIHTTATIEVGQSWINGTPMKGLIEHALDEDWYREEFGAVHCYQIDIWGKEMYDEYKDDDAFHVVPVTTRGSVPHWRVP